MTSNQNTEVGKVNLNKFSGVVSATLLTFILFAVALSANAQSADKQIPEKQDKQAAEKQSDSPEVQQLKERLQRLEQAMLELKGQLSTLEAEKKSEPAIVQATYSTPADAPVPKPQDSKGESSFTIYG